MRAEVPCVPNPSWPRSGGTGRAYHGRRSLDDRPSSRSGMTRATARASDRRASATASALHAARSSFSNRLKRRRTPVLTCASSMVVELLPSSNLASARCRSSCRLAAVALVRTSRSASSAATAAAASSCSTRRRLERLYTFHDFWGSMFNPPCPPIRAEKRRRKTGRDREGGDDAERQRRPAGRERKARVPK
eukprot:scaffold135106_cov30-Tisochrysis_lutea.AAC.1